jgi:two-component system sensor histidine kinase HydH
MGKLALTKSDSLKKWGIFLSLCIITVIHYIASVREVFWHEIFQRAYYLPIIIAALWYGLPGGLMAATLAASLYLPHVIVQWHGFPSYQFNQYSEAVLFFIFAGLTGFLSDRQRREREKLQDTAQRLSEVYAELQRSFDSLRRTERLSALGRLSAGLAHEIRNSCGAVKGAAEILSRAGIDAERRAEFAAIINKELTRLDERLNHFLKFARPSPPRREPVAIHDLMSETCRLVSELATSRRVKVRCRELVSPLAMVPLDPNQVKEVMLNLILNAIEAMPEGGSIELSAVEEDNIIKVDVRDEGTGVTQGDLQQIFDPFYSTKASGTGLGLSIAYQIMHQHGGRIEVTRNADRGMTFSLVFPLTADEGGED